jgi:hypothetical protein
LTQLERRRLHFVIANKLAFDKQPLAVPSTESGIQSPVFRAAAVPSGMVPNTWDQFGDPHFQIKPREREQGGEAS